ncbi:hypothetical protein [Ureibacillus aquaedulcis]|uniref:Uncharacterized protein n=1 Tax=Ureibacillus aquaedulcis TaxID=3058421 RepID=A0ABT8GL47_9BACL|nr:hypothetical protein [Ureibacillus sp. BA0131]MDN4492094.1 hypothetical protein [Ureibacillus sp. BA0131]
MLNILLIAKTLSPCGRGSDGGTFQQLPLQNEDKIEKQFILLFTV